MTVYAILLLLSAAFMAVPAMLALRRCGAPGARACVFLSVVAGAWTTTEAGFQLSTTLDAQLLWAKVSYVSAFAPLMCLLFALDYRRELGGWRQVALGFLLAIPVLTLFIALTNDYHHLLWTRYVPFTRGNIRYSEASYGLWFWVFEVYAYSTSLGGAALLAATLRRNRTVRSWQAIPIVLAIVVTWAANAIYTYRLGPFPGLDLSPLGCAVGAVLFVLSLQRYGLFDLVPVAYDVVVQQLSDGVVVIDDFHRLLYSNPAAMGILGLSAENIGSHLPAIPGLDPAQLREGWRFVWRTGSGTGEKHFEVSIAQLRGPSRKEPGRVLVFHDVTLRRVQDMALQEFQADLLDTNLQLSSMNSELEQSVATSRRLAEEAARARAFSERILTTTPSIVYIYDLDKQNWVYVNQMLAVVLGYSAERALSDEGLRPFISEADRVALRAFHLRCAELADGEVLEFEFQVKSAEGVWRWLLTRETAFTRDPAGRVTQLLGSAVDITSRKHAEKVQQEQEERWQLALHGNNDALWDWDIVKGKIYRSPAWKRMLGYREVEIGDDRSEWKSRVHPDDIDATEAAMQAHLDGRTPRMECEYRMLAKDGSWRWILDRGRCIRDESGNPVRMAGSKTDITERKEVERQLAVEAMLDPLTQLPNRRHLMAEMERRISDAANGGQGLILAIGDVDHFKHVNDNHGHLAGDKVLIALGNLVRTHLRDGDFGGRLGGDEFCFLFSDGSPATVQATLEDVRRKMHAEVFQDASGQEFRTTMTFGATVLKSGMDRIALMTEADEALYAAKQNGRNRVLLR